MAGHAPTSAAGANKDALDELADDLAKEGLAHLLADADIAQHAETLLRAHPRSPTEWRCARFACAGTFLEAPARAARSAFFQHPLRAPNNVAM